MNEQPETNPNEPRKAILIASGGIVERYEPPTEEGAMPGERKPDADQIEERRARLDGVCARLAESNPFFVSFQDYVAKLDNGKKASDVLKAPEDARKRLNDATMKTALVLARGDATQANSNFLAIAGRAAEVAKWYEGLEAEAARLQVDVQYVEYMRDGMTFGTARRFFELGVPPENARKIWGMIYRGEEAPEIPDYGAQSAAVRAFRAQQQGAQLPVMASAGTKPGGASRRPKKGGKKRR